MGLYQRQLQPRLLDLTLRGGEAREIRRRVCAGLSGDVVELGYGSGLNQPLLPPTVTSVTAVEPSAVALHLSEGRRAASAVKVRTGADDAHQMAFEDASFDAALSTWTLCSLAEPVVALREVRRVLKPGGVLHFVEHGLAPDASVVRWQQRGNRLNRLLAGCYLDRPVPALLEAAGMTVISLSTYYDQSSPRPAGYFYEGRAVGSAA